MIPDYDPEVAVSVNKFVDHLPAVFNQVTPHLHDDVYPTWKTNPATFVAEHVYISIIFLSNGEMALSLFLSSGHSLILKLPQMDVTSAC